MRRALDPGLNTPHQGASVSNSHEEVGLGNIDKPRVLVPIPSNMS